MKPLSENYVLVVITLFSGICTIVSLAQSWPLGLGIALAATTLLCSLWLCWNYLRLPTSETYQDTDAQTISLNEAPASDRITETRAHVPAPTLPQTKIYPWEPRPN